MPQVLKIMEAYAIAYAAIGKMGEKHAAKIHSGYSLQTDGQDMELHSFVRCSLIFDRLTPHDSPSHNVQDGDVSKIRKPLSIGFIQTKSNYRLP